MKGKEKVKLSKRFKAAFKAFKDEYASSFNTAEVVLIVFISILFGVIVGCLLTFTKSYDIDDPNLKEIMSTYEAIKDNYYEDVDEKELVNAAVNGMASILQDPNSYYMDKEATDSFNQQINGSFVGVGMSVYHGESDNIIIEIFKDSPAEKAGLQVNDIVTKVGDTDVRGMALTELTNLIKGEKDTVVNITVLRDDKEMSFDVTRGTIELTSVTNKIIEGENKKIGYINISVFASNTYEQFNKSLKSLEKQDIDSLIIDVRNNPGGHLNQAEKILSLFFNKKTVLYQLDTKGSIEKKYSTGDGKRKYEVVVLVNEGSASASEILASCFKENYKNAKIVGTTTYGKGTIQNALELSTGVTVKYTVQKWLTSKGEWINEVGIEPDVVVGQSEEYYSTLSDEDDVQLQKALGVLTGKES